jgi:hypothetical protein
MEQKEWWYKNLFNAVLKLVVSVASTCIDNGRWLKTLMPAMYAPLLYFVTLIAGKSKFLRALVLCMNLLVKIKYMFIINYV